MGGIAASISKTAAAPIVRLVAACPFSSSSSLLSLFSGTSQASRSGPTSRVQRDRLDFQFVGIPSELTLFLESLADLSVRFTLYFLLSAKTYVSTFRLSSNEGGEPKVGRVVDFV